MILLTIITAIVIGGLLNLIKPRASFVFSLSRIFIFLELLITASYWISSFAGIKNAAVIAVFRFLLSWGSLAGSLILGYLVVNILLASRSNASAGGYPVLKITRNALLGVSILTGNIFLMATVGKTIGFKEMTAFFASSGYAVWFLYFIMVAEPLGGLGILLHFKLKMGAWATAGLMLIMLGAVYTHWHNKDPFSDSYAAVAQLITLALMLVLYYFEKRASSPIVNSYKPMAVEQPV